MYSVSLHHAEQNGAKIVVFRQNWNFLWLFKVAKKIKVWKPITKVQDSPKGYGLSVNCGVKPRLQSLWFWLRLGQKKCLRNVSSLTVAMFKLLHQRAFLPLAFFLPRILSRHASHFASASGSSGCLSVSSTSVAWSLEFWWAFNL